MNSAAVNIGGARIFRIIALSGYVPKSGTAVHMATFHLRTLYNIFHSGCTTYIPINNVGGFLFLHIPSPLLFVDFLKMMHYLIKGLVVPHCSLDMHLLVTIC